MTLYSNLPHLSQSFIGFDHLIEQMQKASQNSSNGYPPHNIVKYSEDTYAIELAVAGYAMDDLDIESNKNVLTITGDARNQSNVETDYLYRGISQKKFVRSFNLAEHVQVMNASLVDGILRIELERIVPEELKLKKIPIGGQKQLLTE